MKKLAFLLMCSLLLAACGDKGGDNEPADKENAAATEQGEKSSEYPEYAEVVKTIGDGDYKISEESDTDAERVLIFDGGKKYKSVYLKDRNILKIYDMEDDHLMYNKIFRP